jgi:hypothetical protein
MYYASMLGVPLGTFTGYGYDRKLKAASGDA